MRIRLLSVSALFLSLLPAAASAQTLFATDGTTIKRSDGTNVEVIVDGLSGPSDVEVSGDHIYWSDSGAGKIQRATLDGSDVEDVLTGLGDPRGIAIDPLEGKIYWANLAGDRIERADLDGFNREVVRTLTSSWNVWDVAFDGGRVFWTDFGGDRIAWSNGDGSGPVNAVPLPVAGSVNPRGIAVSGDVVYWSVVDFSAPSNSIWRQTLGMSDGVRVATADTPLYLTLDGDRLYWADETVVRYVDIDGQNAGQFEASFDAPISVALGSVLELEPIPRDTLLVAGDPYTIRWTQPASVAEVDVYLLPDGLDSEQRVHLARIANSYVWRPTEDPENAVFSRSARIAIVDPNDPLVADTSEFFWTKPYHLTRLSEDGARYEPFRVSKHGWRFPNSEAFLFSPSWAALPEHNYLVGIDPFTGGPYSDLFPYPPANASVGVFPDWPSFVRAFGTDDTYWYLAPVPSYELSALKFWGMVHSGTAWNGSCFGMSTASLLAFGHRGGFGGQYPIFGPTEEIYTIDPSISTEVMRAVREANNALYVHQFGRPQRNLTRSALAYAPGSGPVTPRQTLAALKEVVLEDDRSGDATLSLLDVQECAGPGTNYKTNGGHSVVPYRLRRQAGDGGTWRVYVYDPNRPANDEAYIAVDSTANTWKYVRENGDVWEGGCGLFLMDSIVNYLGEAQPSPAADLTAARRAGDMALSVHASSEANVVITAVDGSGSVGWTDGSMQNTLPGALPHVPLVGGPSSPTDYEVPGDRAYAVVLSDSPISELSAAFEDDGRLYAYGRRDAEGDQVDRLVFDPAASGGYGMLTARSDDADAAKEISLVTILTPEGEAVERALFVRNLTLSGPDSVRVSAPDAVEGPRLVVSNLGGAKTYTLHLVETSAEGAPEFLAYAVPLVDGATHTVRPVWETLDEGAVEVDVDLDGDGEPDETLVLVNQVANEPSGPEGLPRTAALHGAYPNPFTGTTTLRYDVPEAGRVRLAVYDLLGREVAVLVDGAVAAGWHEARLDARGLSSGVYVVRMDADGAVQTRRLTLLR